MSSSAYATPPSLETLYCDHHGWLQAWLRRRLGHASDAADLAHDTFLRLIGGASQPRFASMAEVRAYLRTTAKNLCINLWRRQEIERAWLDTLAALPEEQCPSAERQAAVLQALEEISCMLQTLSAKAARAFTLAVVCEMTDDEVGAQLGVSGRMVRKYVAQAMLACLTLRAGETAAALRQEPLY
ncbi:RNA polymerase sigma-70 factor, ECF subfamily [Pseudomonas citronellolis]|uniref:RNA polymerase sigma-70 factor, ECF subfamily n=1 Tax=Pseudomonas citronellolis TaxID=53408 RepID=A0A1A9KD65_9PSED|nr:MULTISPECIES: sigma-70 family RNA polymerase sigma factor [Pseudomonas]KSW27625.1 RNA polymerase subunit sigma [Pseudomonas sp. ADP]MCL6692987.1 sigma-70 family RNA polymerase sigma factor [Pseudomonas sp. R3.Fl]NTX89374.1 sigma-70 family RNA polymerase sigma factor [Pseudomonas sp. UMA643]NTY22247.1 sigma-70 family RNA polymerase sigma factor [Pseudomonas sp. UMC3103]NTY28562.1 sigma-70 family RNA polymerase sigma factor [Pseudomonas sp. UMA603]NTY34003.1 sigma-70 family RNA polymerase si